MELGSPGAALCAFVGGFSMEKYVSSMICADFIVSTPDYFRFNPADEFITSEQIVSPTLG